MRADRLLTILMLLQTRGRMTALDLAEQLEVSERTIYRDLDSLGIAGIPVYAERGPGGGYSLVDGYQTRLTGLTSAEIRALFLSTLNGAINDLGMARPLEDALLKLAASLPEEARSHIEQTRQRFHIDSSTSHDERTALLTLVQDAIWRDQCLSIVYRQASGMYSRYLIDPYGLVAKANEWYLVAKSGDTHRTFPLTHILQAETTSQHFERLADFNLADYWSQRQRTRRSKKTHFVSRQKKKNAFPQTKKSIIKKRHLPTSHHLSSLLAAC